jgi:hypothetical protein
MPDSHQGPKTKSRGIVVPSQDSHRNGILAHGLFRICERLTKRGASIGRALCVCGWGCDKSGRDEVVLMVQGDASPHKGIDHYRPYLEPFPRAKLWSGTTLAGSLLLETGHLQNARQRNSRTSQNREKKRKIIVKNAHVLGSWSIPRCPCLFVDSLAAYWSYIRLTLSKPEK